MSAECAFPSPKPRLCSWEVTFVCNYRCPYCFFIPMWTTQLEEANTRHLACAPADWERFWRRLHALYGSFEICLTGGGEPFTYPGIAELLGRLTPLHTVHVTTNLSWKPETVLGLLDPARVGFTASFHPDFAEPGRFLGHASRLRAAGFFVRAIAIGYPPNLPALSRLRSAFEREGLPLSIAPFVGTYQGRAYPSGHGPAERAVLFPEGDDAGSDSWALGEFDPFGKPCDTGRLYFRALPDGRVFRCAQGTQLEPPIGGIKDPDFRLREGAAPCPAHACHCAPEYAYLADFDGLRHPWHVPERPQARGRPVR